MAAKVFAVGDVLPAGQIKISWDYSSGLSFEEDDRYINGNNSFVIQVGVWGQCKTEMTGMPDAFFGYVGTYTICLSNEVTITFVSSDLKDFITWEVIPLGYSITFEENGGTSVTDLTEQTALPNPLPTPTKANNVFAGWYIDSALTTRAVAGATIESNVTLYAKWYTPTSWVNEIADSIREKEGSSEPIRKVDFADRITALPSPKEEEAKTITPDFAGGNQVVTPTSGKVLSQVTLTKPTDLLPENIAKDKNVCGVVGTSFIAIELTQAQYDALATKDSNTYYLIIEES